MNQTQIREFFEILRTANPSPQTELEYASVFELLAAVLLSAQATDVGVNKATRRLFVVANTPQKILELGEERLAEYIKTIGLYKTKAKNLHATCRILVEQYGGAVPQSREALESLPGVGRKTANVVLGDAFGVPGVTVDTHVGRLSRRLGLTKHTDAVKVEHDLMRLVPRSEWTRFSHQLILHGRAICSARNPRCDACPLNPLCPKIGVLPRKSKP